MINPFNVNLKQIILSYLISHRDPKWKYKIGLPYYKLEVSYIAKKKTFIIEVYYTVTLAKIWIIIFYEERCNAKNNGHVFYFI